MVRLTKKEAKYFGSSFYDDTSSMTKSPWSHEQQERDEKIEQILHCLDQQDVDLWALRELALTRGGLINAEIRQRAWHKLVGLHLSSIASDQHEVNSNVDAGELDLIQRDVGRSVLFRYSSNIRKKLLRTSSTSSVSSTTSTVSTASSSSTYGSDSLDYDDEADYDEGMSTSPALPLSPLMSRSTEVGSEFAAKQDKARGINGQQLLTSVIVSALSSSSDSAHEIDGQVVTRVEEEKKESCNEDDQRRHYYQGLHDVAAVFLINLPTAPHLASAVLHRLGSSHFRDATCKDFGRVTRLLDIAFFPLVQALDEELHDFLIYSEMQPTVILPWLVTWFAHDVHDEECISRLFDAFIASHPLMPLYLAVAIIVHPSNRQKILYSECDAAMVQITIQQLLSGICSDWNECNEFTADDDIPEMEDVLTFQDLIDDAISFMRKIPPQSLPDLAQRYDQNMLGNVVQNVSTISSLQLPPSWALASTIQSDQVQLQQERQKPTYILKASTMNRRPKSSSDIARVASGVSCSNDADCLVQNQRHGPQRDHDFGIITRTLYWLQYEDFGFEFVVGPVPDLSFRTIFTYLCVSICLYVQASSEQIVLTD